jgi:Xaa-Pro dipeptidase
MNYCTTIAPRKTDYELAMMRVPSKLGARAQPRGRVGLSDGASEYGIHMAYLAAVHETESENSRTATSSR